MSVKKNLLVIVFLILSIALMQVDARRKQQKPGGMGGMGGMGGGMNGGRKLKFIISQLTLKF
jgi:hypothetical protein